ncbi:PhpK family radical SAM P-methyltransferase [Tissierella sp.]|uniref:PhpK family radical SAM P-methyltransferase n=1 Tax=Tissierella sp. TaxID=41274 RepID=UPI00303CAA67
MKRDIDCLVIGYNEMNFSDYHKILSGMSKKSGAYRDLNLNFINYKDTEYTVTGIFNELLNIGNEKDKLNIGNTFSATISYLCSYLSRRNLTFDYINSFSSQKEQLVNMLLNDNVLTIAITTTYYVAAFPIIEIVSFIKEYNAKAKIIIGGPFIANSINTLGTNELQYLLNVLKADFYINESKGEESLVQLIECIKNDESYDKVPNLWLNNGKVSAISKKDESLLNDNWVDWSLFKDRINNIVNVRTAISCPFLCSFCGFPQHAGEYQTMDIKYVEKELDMLNQINSVSGIYFIDDTFNIPSDRFKKILEMLIKKKYRFKWHSYFRCQYADEEMVQMMKESGCEGVFLGIESCNEEILENMNKHANPDDYLNGIHLLKKNDIITFASFIVGFPGETEETANQLIEFIEESAPTFYRTQVWYCDKITPIWDSRGKFMIKGEKFSWSHSSMNSETAFDLVDKIFLNVKKSIWLPQYNFCFPGIFQILHRGISLANLKEFLNCFNEGIKEKLLFSNNISLNLERQMCDALGLYP